MGDGPRQAKKRGTHNEQGTPKQTKSGDWSENFARTRKSGDWSKLENFARTTNLARTRTENGARARNLAKARSEETRREDDDWREWWLGWGMSGKTQAIGGMLGKTQAIGQEGRG
jgi:hypothetical protein